MMDRHDRLAGAFGALVLGVALSGCGAGSGTTEAASSTASTLTVRGSIRVSSALAPATDDMATDEIGEYPDAKAGEACITRDGYDDIATGAPVRLATDAGATLALGQLLPGVVPDGAMSSGRFTPCTFGFTLDNVAPGDGAFFTVEVGHRAPIRVTRADLGQPVALTLG